MSENCCVDDDGDLVVMRPSLECCSDVELGVTIGRHYVLPVFVCMYDL